MNTRCARLKNLFAAAVTAVSVAACGGGSGSGGGSGGGSGSGSGGTAPAPVAAPAAAPTPAAAPAPTPAPAPVAVNADLVTSVTPATYASGTTEKGAWDLLNAQRSACGFGLLQQDTRLDVASYNHAYYLVQNSLDKKVSKIGHFEDPTYPYFTGVQPTDRSTFAGFKGGVLELYAASIFITSSNTPVQFIANESLGAGTLRTLLETVYHGRGALWAGRSGGIGSKIGFGPSATAGFNQSQFRLVSEISYETDALKQKLGTGNIATWPCSGLTGVGGLFQPAEELPNPFPEITDTNVKYGTPIYFKADAGSILVVNSSAVTKTSDSSVLVLRQMTKANDPVGDLGDNEVYLVPTTQLASGSTYAVHATGTLDGKAFTKDFRFSTAP